MDESTLFLNPGEVFIHRHGEEELLKIEAGCFVKVKFSYVEPFLLSPEPLEYVEYEAERS